MIDRIVSRVGRRIDESSPLVDARLADGSRVNAIIPPLAVQRVVADHPQVLQGPVHRRRPDRLRHAVRRRWPSCSTPASRRGSTCIVSGGTGTGKTTLLNVLSSFIPEDERIVTIEDAVELQLQQDHVVRLESRPAQHRGQGRRSTIRDLVRNSLRMRPDRIVVGECRGGESPGHAAGDEHRPRRLAVHRARQLARATRIARLETLVLMAGMDLPLRAIREQIASAVDVIVQLIPAAGRHAAGSPT